MLTLSLLLALPAGFQVLSAILRVCSRGESRYTALEHEIDHSAQSCFVTETYLPSLVITFIVIITIAARIACDLSSIPAGS